jgi:aryl-alcohol dehydrogenase-like predicted oxidoreductase
MTPARTTKARRAKPVSPRAPIGAIPLPGSKKPHPALGFGLWGMGRWKRPDEDRTRVSLERAIEVGMRWFDTAEVYGNGRSERVLGEALHRAPAVAKESFVVTKVSWEHLRPEQLRASLVGSLERLGRPYVDLYLVHAPDPHVPLKDTMPALEAIWKEGRIGAIGVSNFSVEEMETAQAALSEARIAVNQVRYNLFDREDGDPIREYCQAHGVVIEAYTPFARGLLHGRYLTGKRVPPEVRRFTERIFEPDRFAAIQERGRALQALANDAGVPLASIALHWLESRGATPLFGASRPDQIDSNLAAWEARPPRKILEEADAIARGDRA